MQYQDAAVVCAGCDPDLQETGGQASVVVSSFKLPAVLGANNILAPRS
jgi:hypothetical protein